MFKHVHIKSYKHKRIVNSKHLSSICHFQYMSWCYRISAECIVHPCSPQDASCQPQLTPQFTEKMMLMPLCRCAGNCVEANLEKKEPKGGLDRTWCKTRHQWSDGAKSSLAPHQVNPRAQSSLRTESCRSCGKCISKEILRRCPRNGLKLPSYHWSLLFGQETWWNCWWMLMKLLMKLLMNVDECWWMLINVDECWWMLMNFWMIFCNLTNVYESMFCSTSFGPNHAGLNDSQPSMSLGKRG